MSAWFYRMISAPSLTGTGFRRKMKKASALWVKNRVNLCTKMCSISSDCFIRMLTRTLFTDGSTRTRSSWLRDTVSGLSSTSGEVFASISGTLCRSEACEAKLDSESAAVSVCRTQERYGRRDWDYFWSAQSAGWYAEYRPSCRLTTLLQLQCPAQCPGVRERFVKAGFQRLHSIHNRWPATVGKLGVLVRWTDVPCCLDAWLPSTTLRMRMVGLKWIFV